MPMTIRLCSRKNPPPIHRPALPSGTSAKTWPTPSLPPAATAKWFIAREDSPASATAISGGIIPAATGVHLAINGFLVATALKPTAQNCDSANRFRWLGSTGLHPDKWGSYSPISTPWRTTELVTDVVVSEGSGNYSDNSLEFIPSTQPSFPKVITAAICRPICRREGTFSSWTSTLVGAGSKT